MQRGRLLALGLLFAVAYAVTTIISAPESMFGLSTVLGTTVLGTTVLGTTVLGVTLVSALASAQLYLSLTCIGLLVFLELSDPNYGPTAKLATAIREHWLPFAVILVGLFFMIVGFKVASIIGF